MAIRIPCIHAIDLDRPGTVRCALNLYGGLPSAGTCLHCTARNQLEGLGDIIASIAQPIARRIDKTLGTNVANCGGCHQRRQSLNKLLPLGAKDA